MTVRTGEMVINQAELAVVLRGLVLSGTPNIAGAVAADMFHCVEDLRERARTGNLTDDETAILRGGE